MGTLVKAPTEEAGTAVDTTAMGGGMTAGAGAGAGAGAMGMGAETDPGAVGLGRMVSMDMRNTEDMVRVHNMEPVAVGVGFLSSILSAAGRRLGNRRRGLLLQLVCCRPSLGPDL